MMPNSILRMFEYNEWAWQRVFPSLARLSDREYFAERPFFWHSLHGLVVHAYGAEWIWLQRCRGVFPSQLPSSDAQGGIGNLAVLRQEWDPLRAEFLAYAEGLSEEQLEADFVYRDLSGKSYRIVLGDLLRHVMNHATEHRSQMTPILHQLGEATEPLDFLYFARRPA